MATQHALAPPAGDYAVLPAAGWHWLTPFYDLGCELLGLGRRFRRDVVTRLALEGDERLLDVGCGTGGLLAEVLRRHPGVWAAGVDADSGILALAARHLARWGGRVALHVGRAEAMTFADEDFDVAVSTLAFHHLPPEAKLAALGEIRRVLRPGGRLLLADFSATSGYRAPWWLRAVETVEYTADHFRGRLPELISAAGLVDVQCVGRRWPAVEYFAAKKPARPVTPPE